MTFSKIDIFITGIIAMAGFVAFATIAFATGIPNVTDITRVDDSPTYEQELRYHVDFSEDVTGVDVTDFSLTTTGDVADAAVIGVTSDTPEDGDIGDTTYVGAGLDDAVFSGTYTYSESCTFGLGIQDTAPGNGFTYDRFIYGTIDEGDSCNGGVESPVEITPGVSQLLTGLSDYGDIYITFTAGTGHTPIDMETFNNTWRIVSTPGGAGTNDQFVVTVDRGTGEGTIRLDFSDDDTVAADDDSTPVGGVGVGNGDFAVGETYTITTVPGKVQTGNIGDGNTVPTDGAVYINWWPTPDDNGLALVDYIVEYKLSSSDIWLSYDDGVSTYNHLDVLGLTNGLSYDFRVAAVNATGTGPFSDTMTETPNPVPDYGAVFDWVAGNQSVHIDWDEPYSYGYDITGYSVQYREPNQNWNTFSYDRLDTEVHVTGLTNDQEYELRVAAINEFGTGWYWGTSEEDEVIPTSGKPSPVTSLSATADSSSQISLSWSAPADEGTSSVTGYKIERESPVNEGFGIIVADTGNTNTTYTDTLLTEEVEYNYRVSAINASGTSAPSDEDATTTLSSDATLNNGQVKGVAVEDPGTPNASDINSVVYGEITILDSQAIDIELTTEFLAESELATVKVVKYSNGQDTGNFSTDTEYDDEAIIDQDFFIIRITAQDDSTLYYGITVTVEVEPEISLLSTTDITQTSAILNGRVDQGDFDDGVGFWFGSESIVDEEEFEDYEFLIGPLEVDEETGEFSVDLSDLSEIEIIEGDEIALDCATTYYVRALGVYGEGSTDVSEEGSFTTASCEDESVTPRRSSSTSTSRRIAREVFEAHYAKKENTSQNDSSELEDEELSLCPSDQILTQNLKAPSRNGEYNSYTGGVVTEAKILQAHLNRLGFNSGPEDGIIGPLTDGAIRRMQTYLGTTPDGYVGPITRGLLNTSCGSKGLSNE